MKILTFVLFIFYSVLGFSQNDTLTNVLYFEEYLGYVKKFHPIVKQANLVISESQINLMKSRGAFDPKIEFDYFRKEYESVEYQNKINGTFKIPTWFGIELKANFEENSGVYLNPESFVPQDGLFSAGISVPVAQGLLINERMASLKQAKLFREQAEADRNILVNNILYKAAVAYFMWLQSYNEYNVYKNFLKNAEFRLLGIEAGVINGENAEIGAVEARIVVNARKLKLEQVRVKLLKTKLELSTFLWLDNNIPIELQPNIIPDENTDLTIDKVLNTNQLNNELLIEQHPKLVSLDFKKQRLEVDRKLKANKLLPKIYLEYNFLTETPEFINSYNTSDYKGGIYASFPLFLRKERGDLKLAKLKLQNINLELVSTRIDIINKLEALSQEIYSYKQQNVLVENIITDSSLLLKSEERKFQLGESSLFMINARETKLIDAYLKAISLQNTMFKTKAKLFNMLSINPQI